MTKNWENILLIAGSGRHVGKTTFICSILKRLEKLQPIAIKITPHFHDETPGLKPLYQNEHFKLCEETNTNSQKDSSLFIQSGAKKSLFLQCTDDHLEEAFIALLPYFDQEKPIVIESAALYKHMQPGMFLVIHNDAIAAKPSSIVAMQVADHTIQSDGTKFSLPPASLKFDKKWTILK